MTQDLINVDYTIVRELKNQGKYKEANDLIRAWQNSIKKNFKEGIKINKSIYNREMSFKIRRQRKKKGVCMACGNEKEEYRRDKSLCETCSIKYSLYKISKENKR